MRRCVCRPGKSPALSTLPPCPSRAAAVWALCPMRSCDDGSASPTPGQDWALNDPPPIPGTPEERGISQHKKQAVLTSSIGHVLVCTWLGLTCSASQHRALYKVALNHIFMSFGDITKDPLPVSPFPSQMIS